MKGKKPIISKGQRENKCFLLIINNAREKTMKQPV